MRAPSSLFLCLLLSLWLLLAGPPARAHSALAQPRFDSVGDANSVPQSVVSALVQDPAGFLWIGTGAGLVRHDGYNFRLLQSLAAPGQPAPALGFVRTLMLARDGRLWIGTESDGLAVHDPRSHRSTLFQHRSDDAGSVSPGTLRALAEDRDGAIWVGTIGHGLDRYDPATGRFSHIAQGQAGLEDGRVQALLVDRDGSLWVGGWTGLSRRRAGAARFERVAPALTGQIVSALYQARDGRIWAGTQQGRLALVEPGDGTALLLPPSSAVASSVHSFAEALPGQVWVGRGGGIEQRGLDGALLRLIRHQPEHTAGLASNEVRALLVDRAGWVWAGSYGGGLQRHNPANTSIWVRRSDLGQGGVFAEPSARSLLQLANGEIWVGTGERGVAIMDSQLRLIGALRPGPGGLGNGRIGALAQTRDGAVWVASDAGLYQLDAQRRIRARLQAGEGRVRRLLAGRHGALWIGTQDGLFRHLDGKVERLALQGGGPLSGDINGLAEAEDGRLWVGTEKGLFQRVPGETGLRPVAARLGAELSHPSVVGLLLDREQRLWVDTASGLHRLASWDGQEAGFERVSARLGRGGQAFGANLLEDERGRIWSQRHVYDRSLDRIDELGAADGADFGTGWFRAYVKLADGRLLFGGSKGLLVVTPGAFDGWRYAPPLVVTELRVDGQRRSLADPQQGLSLLPGERGFSIEFAALDYSDPGRSVYAYRLQGFDADWVHTDAALRVASYGNLAPGDYVLQARATNRAGIWSPHTLSLPVTVLPAWWQQAWFRALAVLAGLALLWAVVQLRTRVLRRRQAALERRVGERTAELQALSQALQDSSMTDPLTGLRNRRFLTQHIDADVAMVLRRHEAAGVPPAPLEELIFFLLDIDEFKQVNDQYGHAAGDAVLSQMRERLRPVFRESDYLVRWGGEEFLIVARASTRAHAAELAERARQAVAGRPFVLDDGRLLARSASLGFACFPLCPRQPLALSWAATVGLADAALYAAKRAGRDRWVGVLGLCEDQVLRPRPAAEWLASGELALQTSAGFDAVAAG
ncbi:diguanylate cyclase [Paucibacter sp. PLA-PC-4]|uniref:ligand-binding sensor domain-containing diguanylate cyclase n=1 Tax=Paucibacter sp. PLA-PC-4 TaxID=2993655 RepID=UPI00224A6DD3|nr:ligand-binding sensor domain-containing diguanylate cyclase [Paucibacter sp. PLA-PC-4]MCX2864854.1 diguanylate cyclase [Paucibacter sp. PLA-PC-4]